MPEARDRLSRARDVASVYTRRRRPVVSGGYGRGEIITILADDPVEESPTTPFRWGTTPLTGSLSRQGAADASGGGGGGGIEWSSLGTPRIWRGTVLQMSPGTVSVRRSTSQATRSSRYRRRSQGNERRGGILPDWYPRTPLVDITETVRAIERRRARLRDDEGPESPIDQGQIVLHPAASAVGAQLEHDSSMFTPCPKIKLRPHPASIGKVSKILLDITNQHIGESSALTPQKMLLNSIDTVEKVVMEELHKLKRTPMAKKVERERKVGTLLSMR